MKKTSTSLLVLISIVFLLSNCNNDEKGNQVNTVQGPIPASELGVILTHEHIMSNFGRDIIETSEYDSLQLFKQILPYLKHLKTLGVNSIFDCTTAHFGRRVDLLNKISEATGIQIITNTGFYGAANDRYIPQIAYESTAEAIAELWIDEFNNGIDGTDIKPGFVKMAFDDDKPLSDIDKKLFEAGILTHLSTGLTLGVHTGKNTEAVKFQRALLQKYEVDLSAWIWTHANKMDDDSLLIELASQGAWISLDGVKESNVDAYIERLKLFKQKNLLHKVLLSHDGNGFPKGGAIRQFDAILKDLIPEMLMNGFIQEDIDLILKENPVNAFHTRVRMA